MAEQCREEVEHDGDAERVVLADAHQALLRYGPLPQPSSLLVIHRSRDPSWSVACLRTGGSAGRVPQLVASDRDLRSLVHLA